jgi:N-acetyltransferase 10
MIMDLVPILAKLFFLRRFSNMTLSYTQAAILLGVGLQYKLIEDIAVELNTKSDQLLAMFNKMIKKFRSQIRMIYEKEIDKSDIKNKNVNVRIYIFYIFRLIYQLIER